MKTIKEDILKVKALPHLGECTIAWSEEGGGIIVYAYDMYFLFIVPGYGGEAYFDSSWGENRIEAMVEYARMNTS